MNAFLTSERVEANRRRIGAKAWRELGVVAALLIGLTPCAAEENIGGAMIVVNRVNGALPAGNVVVVQGDGVFRDEGMRTDVSSSAKLVLRDDTNLSLGPNSSVKLDRFVYSGAQQPGAIAINLAKGTFRFATGNADKQAYTITTPTATLGVRGTVFFVSVVSNQTYVRVGEGHVHACAHDGINCLDLGPSDRGNFTNTSAKLDTSPSDPNNGLFDALCQGGLCTTTPFTQFARNDSNATDKTGALGGGPAGGDGGFGGGGSGGALNGNYLSGGGGGGGGGNNNSSPPSGNAGTPNNPITGGTFGGGSSGGGSTIAATTASSAVIP